MPNHNELLQKLHTQKYSLGRIYANLSKELSHVLKKHKATKSLKVWKNNKKLKSEIDLILRKYNNTILTYINNNIKDGWFMANKHKDAFVDSYLKGINIPANNSYYNRNNEALSAFLQRSNKGFTLSDRVWNLTQQNRTQLEYFVASGLADGRSAQELTKDIHRFLKNPEKRFKRLKSPTTGKLQLSDPAKNYKPGRGVYRSSYKNALRLARNEISIAYRTADHLRRQNLPFVTGIEIHLSNAHPRYDICDELQGEYPKGFTFVGWHPNCLCFTTAKLLSKEEFKKYLKTNQVSEKEVVKTIPDAANRYLTKHGKELKSLKSKPYFIKDNFKNTKDGIALKKSIGLHIPYVEIPNKRVELKSLGKKIQDDYDIVFNQKSTSRNEMMKSFLSRATNYKENRLLDQQKAIIYGYTTTSVHYDLNRLLLGLSYHRKSSEYLSFLTAYKNTLNHSLKNLPNYKGMSFRGVSLNNIDRYEKALKTGLPLKEEFFISTSRLSQSAFKGNIKFVITGKRGKSIKHLSAYQKSEDEILFSTDTKFKVTKIIKKDGTTTIFMEEV